MIITLQNKTAPKKSEETRIFHDNSGAGTVTKPPEIILAAEVFPAKISRL